MARRTGYVFYLWDCFDVILTNAFFLTLAPFFLVRNPSLFLPLSVFLTLDSPKFLYCLFRRESHFMIFPCVSYSFITFYSILPGGQPTANPLEDLGTQTGTSVTWLVNFATGMLRPFYNSI